jgi:hypothetical protein
VSSLTMEELLNLLHEGDSFAGYGSRKVFSL